MRLGESPRMVTATGTVVSEPKISPNGFASFLFKLRSVQLDGKAEPSTATVLARWHGHPQFGDKLRLSGIGRSSPGSA